MSTRWAAIYPTTSTASPPYSRHARVHVHNTTSGQTRGNRQPRHTPGATQARASSARQAPSGESGGLRKASADACAGIGAAAGACGLLSSEAAAQLSSQVAAAAGATEAGKAEAAAAEEASTVAAAAATREGEDGDAPRVEGAARSPPPRAAPASRAARHSPRGARQAERPGASRRVRAPPRGGACRTRAWPGRDERQEGDMSTQTASKSQAMRGSERWKSTPQGAW